MDNSIVIDCTKYSDSLKFPEIHSKQYWNLFEKYKITSEQFEEEKSKNKCFQYDLKTFLKYRKMNF